MASHSKAILLLFRELHYYVSIQREHLLCAGLVVDSQVVHPTEYSFFLNSHAGLKVCRRSHFCTAKAVLASDLIARPDNIDSLVTIA